MDQLNDWATNLAMAADPSEADLALDIVDAYIEGGASREELFTRTDTSIAGGFGPGSAIALLPLVLRGITAAGKWILTLVSADATGNVVGVVKDLLDIGKDVTPKEKLDQLPDTSPYTALKRVIDTVGLELRTAGIEANEADLITFRVLNSLLEDPQGTATFIEQSGPNP
ncbi:hypothetical protein VB780_31065 [Leptolyngbya sp. CCNP1308]|uniref:hypothetical protein n=1 Tax=Leptolyngbya sp. CCNP1308 TaxID=3110255 RepID=UPI002B1F5965|nr:hypothetical protein [Leptolyngbya sp. CCNP1308]MEA5453053.1 hypothetical protein [Leptolyngbya sp. CCNP1308]